MYGKMITFICEGIKIEIWIPCTPKTTEVVLEKMARNELLKALESDDLKVSFK